MENSTAPDRYVTFKNIDCEGNTNRLINMLRSHIDQPQQGNPFWEKMTGLLDRITQGIPVNGIRMDYLFFIHSYINNIRDIFEQQGDEEALELLERIERESC